MIRFARSLVFAASLVLAPFHIVSAQDLKPIKIGFQTGEINVILSYALGSGLFKANGLDVKTAQFPAGPAMLPGKASRGPA